MSKPIPIPVQLAKQALDSLRAENTALAESVQKILPGFAVRLEKEGQDISVDILLDHARQGIEHLKAPRLFDTPKLLTYAEVVAAFPAAPPEEDDEPAVPELSAYEDVNAVRRLLEEKGHETLISNILTRAAEHGHTEVLRLLAEHPAAGYSMDGALQLAICNGHAETAHMLIEKGASFDGDIMATAARSGSIKMLQMLLDRGVHIDGRKEASTPLMMAIMCGHPDAARWLISQGASIDVVRGPGKETALMWAAKCGHVEIVRLLLERGAEIDKPDLTDYGIGSMTAMMKAAANGHADIVKVLLDNGANIHKQSYEGWNALAYAVKERRLEVARLLLERGADPHFKTPSHSCTMMYQAVTSGSIEICRLLLDHGADVNALVQLPRAREHVLEEGPLEYACRYGKMDIVRLLLDSGACVERPEGIKGSALSCAVSSGNLEIVKLLLERGADIDRPGENILCKAEYVVTGINVNERDVVPLLMDYVASLDTVPKNLVETYVQMHKEWKEWCRIAGADFRPEGLLSKDPSYFRKKDFEAVRDTLNKESHMGGWANEMAYNTIALFGSEQRVLKYLQKWGEAGKQPLHELIQVIKFPQGKIDTKAWSDAVMACGPGMAKLVKFADRLPQPLKGLDGKNWSLQKTREAIAQFAYPRANEFPALAALCMEHELDEEDFEKVVALVQDQKKDIVKNLPEITIDGKVFGLNGYRFHRLPVDDARGLILGELTDCCQSIGGAGAACAEHGFMSKDGGFYVVEKENGEIIGQTWAWRGEGDELVFDSLETLGKRVTDAQWVKLANAFARALAADPGNVTAFHIGVGGATPRKLCQAFAKAAAKPKDHTGYRDSAEQAVIWRKPKSHHP